MEWVRKKLTRRALAVLMTASLLPPVFLHPARGVAKAQFGTYERWIRAQLRIPIDEVVEKAMAEAAASRAPSFEGFVIAFLKSYKEAAPDRSTARAFTDRDLTNDALLTYLQARFTQIVEDGVLVRVYPSTPASVASSGEAGIDGGTIRAELFKSHGRISFVPTMVDRFVVVCFRTLSSARSLGP